MVIRAYEMGAVAALDPTVELGGIGWQDEELDIAELTGLLEGGPELRSTIDLDGFDRERHAMQHALQEVGGSGGSGLAVDLDLIPTPDDVASVKVFQGQTGHRTHIHGIDRRQITGSSDRVFARLPDSEWPWNVVFSMPPSVARRFMQIALLLQVVQDPTDG
jgi:hypothetical protein